MTASSQTPSGALPPELPARPLSEMERAAFAAYGAVLPVPAGPASGTVTTSPVRAAAGVIEAAMTNGAATAQEIAQAEQDAGLLFNPQLAEDIASAAAEQAHAEDQAEIDQRGQQLAVMAGVKRQLDAVGRLIEGRPGHHMMSVAEIAAAAEFGKVPHDGSFPMSLGWTGRASVPDAHTTRQQVVLECVSSYGGRAELVVEGVKRAALASLLDEEARDIHAPCPTEDCGSAEDYDPSDPTLQGWARVEVAGAEGGPRWFCSSPCVSAAMARAADDLALGDREADGDPEQQQPAAAAGGAQ
ncbi:hypothetical protein [Streptomyces sp. NPDC051014]|uniref:hypothetical protein n=1 Tax=Streptomyces sp. NPDC051014 TaxID=3155751 RepID=UPI0033D35D76